MKHYWQLAATVLAVFVVGSLVAADEVRTQSTGGVTLLPEAFRSVFLEGERPRIDVVVKTTARIGGAMKLTMTGPVGDGLSATTPIGGPFPPGRHTRSFTLDTARLRPGRYVLSATLGAIASRPVILEIAPRTRRTDFVIFEWTWGGSGLNGGTDYIDALADARMNLIADLFEGAAYDLETDQKLAARCAADPNLPAAESATRLGKRGRLMEHLLRRGISFLQEPPYFSAHFRQLYHSLPEDESRETMRYVQRAYQMRHFPAAVGNVYHEECFTRLPGRDIKAPWKDPEKPADKEAIRGWLFWKEFNRWADGKPEDLVKSREAEFRASLLANQYEAWQREIHKLDPSLMNGPNHGPLWGYDQGGYTPAVADSSSFGFSHLYTDRGIAPWSGPQFVQWWRRGQSETNRTPVWIAALAFGRRGDQREVALATLGQKVEGFGWTALSGRGGMVGAAGLYEWSGQGRNYYHNTGRRERAKTINEICERYGNLFLDLKRDKHIAVLCSFTQSVQEGPLPRGGLGPIRESHLAVAAGACHDLARAHFPANMVSEKRIAEGVLTGYKALALPGVFAPLPPRTTKAIREFIRRGGLVFGDERTQPDELGIEGIHVIPKWRADEIPFHINGNDEYKIAYERSQQNKKALLPFLKRHLTSTADCADSRILISVQRYGEAKYLFATNDTVPPFDWKTPSQCWLHQAFHYPVRRKITLAEPGAVYDVFEQRRVLTREVSTPAAGKVRFKTDTSPKRERGTAKPAVAAPSLARRASVRTPSARHEFEGDFTRSEGKLYAVLPKPIEGMSLKVSRRVKAGENVRFQVRVEDADKRPIRAAFPIEIRVTDPRGDIRYHLFRSCHWTHDARLKIAVNDRAGKWKIRIKELISGMIADGQFEVGPAGGDVLARCVQAGDAVITSNSRAVAQFANRKRLVWIMLSPKQEYLLPKARELAAALSARGIDCSVKKFNIDKFETNTVKSEYTRAEWEQKQQRRRDRRLAVRKAGHYGHRMDSTLMRKLFERPYDIYADVILIGKRGENRLLDSIIPTELSSRNLPGSGRGFIEFVPSPFVGGYDALAIVADDEAGLEKCVERIVSIPRREGEAPAKPRDGDTGSAGASPSQSDRLLPGRHAAPYVLPTSASDLDEVRSTKRQPRDFLEGRTGDVVGSISVSEDGNRIAVCTDAFGNNVLVLDGHGNLLWRGKAGSLHALGEVTGDGQFVLAGAYTGGNTRGTAPGLHTFGFLDSQSGGFLVQHPLLGPMQTGGSGPSYFLFNARGKAVARAETHLALYQHLKRPEAKRLARSYHIAGSRVWCEQSGNIVWEYDDYSSGTSYEELRHPCHFDRFATSPDRRFLAVAGHPLGDPNPYTGVRPKAERFASRATILLVDASTGKLHWRKQGIATDYLELDDTGSVTIERNGTLQEFDRRGAELNRLEIGGTIRKVVRRDDLLAAVAEGSRQVVVSHRATGRRSTFSAGGVVHDIAVSHDGQLVIVGAWDHQLYAIDASGELKWRVQLNGAPLIEFSRKDPRIIAGTNNGRVYAITLDGRIDWDRDITPDALVPVEQMHRILRDQGQLPVIVERKAAADRETRVFQSMPKSMTKVGDNLLAKVDWPSDVTGLARIRNPKYPCSGRTTGGAARIEIDIPNSRRNDTLIASMWITSAGASGKIELTFAAGDERSMTIVSADESSQKPQLVELAIKAVADHAVLDLTPSDRKGSWLIEGIEVRRLRFARRNVLPGVLAKRADAMQVQVLDAYAANFARPPRYASHVAPAKLADGRISQPIGPLSKNRLHPFSEVHVDLGTPRRLSGLVVYGRAASYFVQAWDNVEKQWRTVAKVNNNNRPLRVISLENVVTRKLRMGVRRNGHISEMELLTADSDP